MSSSVKANTLSYQAIFKTPAPQASAKNCQQLFASGLYFAIHQKVGFVKTALHANKPLGPYRLSDKDPLSNQMAESILQNWSRVDELSSQRVEAARSREAEISPIRKSYHQFSFEGEVAGARVIDGSAKMKTVGLDWKEASQQSPLTAIEKKYQIRFPERQLSHGGYLWEVGLVSSPKTFRTGALALMSKLAFRLNQDYNSARFGTFADVRELESIDFAIYAVARERVAKHNERLGFKRVKKKNDRGIEEDWVFDDGLVLLRMSGADLVKRYYSEMNMPSLSGQKTERKEPSPELLNHIQERNKAIQERRFVVDGPAHAKVIYQENYARLIMAKKMQEGSKEQWAYWRAFIEDLYTLWMSTPLEAVSVEKHKDIEVVLHNLLTQFRAPRAIYYTEQVFGPGFGAY